MQSEPTELPASLGKAVEGYLRILGSGAESDRRARLEFEANVHLDIARLYDHAGLPWAIPHYREAFRCWEFVRSLIGSVDQRLQMLERLSHWVYYPLVFAYLRELERPADRQPPAFPAEDARWQEAFARSDAPDGLAALRNGNALIYAYQILEAARARTFVDRLQARHSVHGLEAPSLQKMAELLAPGNGHRPAALITWLPATEGTHVFRLTAAHGLEHRLAPVSKGALGELTEQIRDDHHDRLFNVVRPRTSSAPHWHVLRTFGPLIEPMVEDLEPGTPLVLEPDGTMAQLPLSLLPLGKNVLIERHPVSVISCNAHLLTARRRHTERRLSLIADVEDRILAVGVGRSESERRRCDFDPLREWAEPQTAPPERRVERLLWERATVAGLKERLPGQRFCAFTCHGHYQQLDVEESGLLLYDGKLDLQTLAGIDLDVDVAFCNTCVSGQSRTKYGGEPFGIPMSLALAGAPCVVGSLWDVWYEAGRHVLRGFFQNRRAEERQAPASIALRRATLSARERFPDAFHWGGWTLYGDWI